MVAEQIMRELHESLRIWWLSQRDCEAIATDADSVPVEWPQWLKDQFKSRWGRAGRGRLWIDREQFGDPDDPDYRIAVDPWPDTPLARMLGNDCGGIVVDVETLPLLKTLPGVITDMKLERV